VRRSFRKATPRPRACGRRGSTGHLRSRRQRRRCALGHGEPVGHGTSGRPILSLAALGITICATCRSVDSTGSLSIAKDLQDDRRKSSSSPRAASRRLRSGARRLRCARLKSRLRPRCSRHGTASSTRLSRARPARGRARRTQLPESALLNGGLADARRIRALLRKPVRARALRERWLGAITPIGWPWFHRRVGVPSSLRGCKALKPQDARAARQT